MAVKTLCWWNESVLTAWFLLWVSWSISLSVNWKLVRGFSMMVFGGRRGKPGNKINDKLFLLVKENAVFCKNSG